ncbi:MAG: hypothetical protein IT424_06845 [Pirellulales bacterium]|nr:hypothetical protein [Pirellulales bacterium]
MGASELIRRRLASGFALLVIALSCAAAADDAQAARTILFETFENDTPDQDINTTVPESVDVYGRSLVVPPPDPSFAYISGGLFPDPFAAGNQSLVLHNPNGAAQMTANFADFFDADPAQFRNGAIEFDVYFEAAEPGSYWTYLDVRFGFDTNGDPRLVTTQDDVTIWNSFRIQEGGDQPGAVDVFYDHVSAQTYNDQQVVVPERKMRVRYDIDGSDNTYTVSIDNLEDPDAPVQVVWPSGAVQEWDEVFNFETFQFEPAPGINVIAFLTDASAYATGSHKSQNVYIDNLRVINNDLPPLESADFDDDGDVDGADFLIWQRGNGTTSGATPDQGDANGDMAVDAADLAVFTSQFGQAGGVSAVPEPATAWLALAVCFEASAMAAAGRKRERRSTRRA